MAASSRAIGVNADRGADGAVTGRLGNHDERGSAAIEAAVGVPAFVLFVGLIIVGGRVAITHQAVESAAAEAARSASIARSQGEAEDEAMNAAEASLANQSLQCLSVDVTVDVSAFNNAAGEAGQVAVTVSCRLDLADLSVPGAPGAQDIRATMTSPLDTWRERS